MKWKFPSENNLSNKVTNPDVFPFKSHSSLKILFPPPSILHCIKAHTKEEFSGERNEKRVENSSSESVKRELLRREKCELYHP